MCLVLIALSSHPDYPLIVAANRDEFYDRPTDPAGFWNDEPAILAGRDLKAGGTWLGIDRRGRFAAVTNYRQGRRERPAPRSRGHLVSDFLTASIGVREYIERAKADAELYNGFNLIAGDARELFYYSNREGRARALEPGVYGLSNHLLDTAWPKVTATKSAFGALLSRGADELIDGLFRLLSDRNQFADDQLPHTGVGPEWERLLSSAFIASSNYGTRCSTVVLVGQDGGIVFVERNFCPGGTPAEQGRFTLPLRDPSGPPA
jgi:uncharacterized protein with NRDE domain